MADTDSVAEWTPRVRRITAPNVGEKGKLTFIRSLIGEQRFDEAADELRDLLESNPRSYIANIQMGRLLERKERHDQAVEHFETAHAANPTQAEAPLLAGTSYLRLKDFDRAAAAFQTALTLDPKRAPAHLGLAQVHFRRDELDQAIARVQQALSFDPELKQARTLMARIHNRRGDSEQTKLEIHDILDARPDQLRPAVALARIHLKNNEPAEALALLEAAATHHEGNAQLWSLIGRAKLTTGDYKGAEAGFRQSLSIDPRQRELAPHLIDALIPQGKLQEARAVLDRLPDAARRSARVLAGYGKIHLASSHYKQAAESFRAALLRRTEEETDEDDEDSSIVAGIAEQPVPQGDADWKALAEKYQAALQDLRRSAGEDEERGARRKLRAKRRRDMAGGGKG